MRSSESSLKVDADNAALTLSYCAKEITGTSNYMHKEPGLIHEETGLNLHANEAGEIYRSSMLPRTFENIPCIRAHHNFVSLFDFIRTHPLDAPANNHPEDDRLVERQDALVSKASARAVSLGDITYGMRR